MALKAQLQNYSNTGEQLRKLFYWTEVILVGSYSVKLVTAACGYVRISICRLLEIIRLDSVV
jgi:hypothetical protein